MKPYNKLTNEMSNYNNKGNRMYALTVHDNKLRWPSPYEYEKFLYELERVGFKVIDYVYEVGKLTTNKQSGKLHLQGTVLGPNPLPYMKEAFPVKGFSYTLRPLTNEVGWDEYNHKAERREVEEYMISHFWDMDLMDYNIVNPNRKS